MKNINRWKSFEFDLECNADKKSPVKKIKIDNSKSNIALKQTIRTEQGKVQESANIETILSPKCVADLCVHSKKIEEVEGWLKHYLINQSYKKICTKSNIFLQKATSFLLINGPTGSAKTTTVKVLCKSLAVECLEWTNPIDIEYEETEMKISQVTKFLEFFKDSRYSSLCSPPNSKKIILVKDYPNAFLINPIEFHDVLEEIYCIGTCPVVFLCTDTCTNQLNIQRSLFPEEILLKYAITSCSFNPCASTLMKKALKRFQELIPKSLSAHMFEAPSSATIDAILASSMGDIRCAMNQFYLACLKACNELPTTEMVRPRPGVKRKRGETNIILKNKPRDELLGLFHGLGRVLNPKRMKTATGTWRISCDVEKLVDEFSVEPTKFVLFLIENYLKYFGDVSDAARSAHILSCAMPLMENWQCHDTLVMSLWMSVLGVMVFNEHKVSKWNQIKGPQKVNVVPPSSVSSIDGFYYNLISKTNKFHNFKCRY